MFSKHLSSQHFISRIFYKPFYLIIISVSTTLWVPLAYCEKPIPVTVKPLEQLIIYPEITVPASVITLNDTRLSAEITATVKNMPAQVGEVVEQGTPLIQLDPTDLKLTLLRAQATLKLLSARHQLAKRQLERVQSLAKQNMLSKEELNQRQTELEVTGVEITVQRINLKRIRRDLEKTTIRAPFKAIILEYLSHIGELAMISTPLVHVLDATEIQLTAKLQPGDVASIKHAESIKFKSRNDQFLVEIAKITPALDVRERSQEIRLRFVNKSALIGTTGNLTWTNHSPYLPAYLLVRRNNALGVFILNGKKTKFITILEAEEGSPVKSNLDQDSKIIIDGRFIIQDGVQVKVVNN